MGNHRAAETAAEPLIRQNASSHKLSPAVAGGRWLDFAPDLPPMIVRRLRSAMVHWHEPLLHSQADAVS
jgi:hypothetical protein